VPRRFIARRVTTEDTSAPRFRLRIVPLLVVTALGVGVPYLAAYLAILSSKVLHTPSPHGPTLPWLYMHHALQALIALVAIAVVKRFVPGDYGLHWPRGKTYVVSVSAIMSATGLNTRFRSAGSLSFDRRESVIANGGAGLAEWSNQGLLSDVLLKLTTELSIEILGKWVVSKKGDRRIHPGYRSRTGEFAGASEHL